MIEFFVSNIVSDNKLFKFYFIVVYIYVVINIKFILVFFFRQINNGEKFIIMIVMKIKMYILKFFKNDISLFQDSNIKIIFD